MIPPSVREGEERGQKARERMCMKVGGRKLRDKGTSVEYDIGRSKSNAISRDERQGTQPKYII